MTTAPWSGFLFADWELGDQAHTLTFTAPDGFVFDAALTDPSKGVVVWSDGGQSKLTYRIDVPKPGVVNKDATGAPTIKVNKSRTKLKASLGTVADANGLSTPTWIWQRRIKGGWAVMNATTRKVKITEDLRGSKVRVIAWFTDGAGFEEYRWSLPRKVR